MNKVQFNEAQRLVKRINKETTSLHPYVVTSYLYDNGSLELFIQTQHIINGEDTRKLMMGLFSLGLNVWLSSINGCPRICAG